MLIGLKGKKSKKETLCDKCRREQPCHSCQDITELGRCVLEHQCEQKSNKVEPKFKVRDWIACEGLNPLFITNFKNHKYEFEFIDGAEGFSDIDYIDSVCHLWTLNDAKSGDVLSYVTDEGDLWILIYESLYKPYEGHVHYHALLANGEFSDKGTCCISIENLKPATKKQRDLLFKEMGKSGYKWNVNRKEMVSVLKYE